MQSYEILKRAIDESEEGSVKVIAEMLGVSAALVYKWVESSDGSGAHNPLERCRDLYLLTEGVRLLHWLCHQAKGIFVADGHISRDHRATSFVALELPAEFGRLMAAVPRDSSESSAAKLREQWARAKSLGEGMVREVERRAELERVTVWEVTPGSPGSSPA